nr:head-tail connector protein [Pseudomonas guariconensis]
MVVSKSIEQGALMLIGHWYANRESVAVGGASDKLPMATEALWRPHRWVNV